MAPKDTAPAAKDDVRDATVIGYADRSGAQYPTLRVAGEAPKKGANLRIRLDNGVTYTAKAYAVAEDGSVETEGLTPEAPEQPAPPPSDIVAG